MKIFKVTPKQAEYFDMGSKGKCSALYIKAESENDARYFALLNKQTSTIQDVVIGKPPALFENMFTPDNANCIELSIPESQNMSIEDDLGINLIKIDLSER